MKTSIFHILLITLIFPTLSTMSQSIILNDKEKADLCYLYEEEKLARDVYKALGDQYDMRIFRNIQQAEIRHMDHLKELSTKYELTLSSKDLEPQYGQFEDDSIQDLYSELLYDGSRSIEDALKIGVRIEELDIKDLSLALEQTENKDLIRVYSRLINASKNHLKAFTKNLKRESGSSNRAKSRRI